MAVATHNCDANAACTDTNGSFTCACAWGYEDTGSGTAGECVNPFFDLAAAPNFLSNYTFPGNYSTRTLEVPSTLNSKPSTLNPKP